VEDNLLRECRARNLEAQRFARLTVILLILVAVLTIGLIAVGLGEVTAEMRYPARDKSNRDCLPNTVMGSNAGPTDAPMVMFRCEGGRWVTDEKSSLDLNRGR
jgi:hypothetical protein